MYNENMTTFKQVKGYEGLYEVSACGKVKSLAKTRGKQSYPERILKLEVTFKGYLRAMLSRFGEKKKIYVHRIVAEAFLSTRPEGTEINHKNSIKADNRAQNLEWVTGSENMRHHYSKKRAF